MDIGFFTNDKYKILACMQERQIDISGNQCVPLSQREIADITGIAYKTVNNAIKKLKDSVYILHNGKTRGKYSLTEKATNILEIMQKEGVQE